MESQTTALYLLSSILNVTREWATKVKGLQINPLCCNWPKLCKNAEFTCFTNDVLFLLIMINANEMDQSSERTIHQLHCFDFIINYLWSSRSFKIKILYGSLAPMIVVVIKFSISPSENDDFADSTFTGWKIIVYSDRYFCGKFGKWKTVGGASDWNGNTKTLKAVV